MNIMELKISVVIPSYNPDLKTLAECLKAIQDSNFKPLEVILVDDGSLIDYPEEIRACCKIIKNQKNMGPACARNIGAKQAKGNILFFLDSDVKIANSTFNKIAEKFNNADIAAVQTIYSKLTPVKNFLSQYQNLYQHYNFKGIRQEYLCRLSSYAVAVKKDVFFEVGGFPEFVKNASIEDGLLGMALYSQGYRILLAGDIQVEHLAYFDIRKLLSRMFILGRDAIIHSRTGKNKRTELSKTHHRANQIVAILLSPLILVALMTAVLAIGKMFALLFISAFLLINAGFFIFLYKLKGIPFMLKSIIMYYLACLAIFLGFLKGINYSIMKYAPYIKKSLKLFNKHNILPEYITFFVTNKCNASCEHCFYWKELNAPIKELSIDEIEKISRTIGNFSFLILTGGEPFLRDDLAEILKIFYKTNNLRKMSIMTNGSMPDKVSRVIKDILEECTDLYITLFVSLDEIEDRHDRIRGVEGIYKNALETIMGLKETQAVYPRLSLGVALVYTSYNQEKIADIYRHIKININPDTINCTFVRGDIKNKLLKTRNIDNFIKLQEIIKSDLIHNDSKGVFYPIIGKIVKACKFESISQLVRIVKEDKYCFPCYAGKINAVIYPNGDVFPCELLNEKMGNLRENDYNFKKIWFSKRSGQIRKRIKKTKCYCTHGCNLLPNIMFNFSFSAKVIKNYLRLVFKI